MLRRQQSLSAVFDLGILSDLSDEKAITLYVSDRSLYILNNLAIADITHQERYAVSWSAEHYLSVEETDTGEYALYQDVVERLQEELIMVRPYAYVEVAQQNTYGTLSASPQTVNFTSPDEGELWELQSFGVNVYGTQPSFIALTSTKDGVLAVLATMLPAGSGLWRASYLKNVVDEECTIGVLYTGASGAYYSQTLQYVKLAT